VRRSRVTSLTRLRRTAGLLAVAPVLWGIGSASAFAEITAPAAGGSSSWTVYHANPAGTGVAAPVAAVDTTKAAWTSPALDGQVYGEPLAFAGRVYVATENDTVYALSAATGSVAWSRHLGRPVPATSLPCGDISPSVGITGTPVIDQSRAEIFVVADELAGGRAAHRLVGLSTGTGAVEMTQDVDPPGADPAALLQRTGLNLDSGQVVFGLGGNYGDCASYQGRVEAVPETGGPARYFTVDAAPGESQGAVWMGGAAPVIDGSGHVWVSTGNGSVYSDAHAYDDSDSVLELSSSLQLLQFFAPSTWPTNNSRDLDMSTAPVLLPDGQVLLAGKSRIVYLLNGAHLGGIGHQQATLGGGPGTITGSACGSDIDGGAAVVGLTVFLPCTSGLVAVRVASSPPALHLLWSSGIAGGPPIVAAGLVWTIGYNGVLYGLDPATGRVRQQAAIGALANHFPTPSVGDGLLLVPGADRVVAFAAPAPGAAAAPTPVTSETPHPSSPPHAAPTTATHSSGDVAAIAVAGLVILGGLGWFVRWQRIRARR
jgi:outer membrane protein assembly factor BamB